MDSGVDIIVTSRQTARPELVVEVKLGGDKDAATGRLRRYMNRVGAPLGLVVVGPGMRLLRDTYRTSDAESIEVVSEFETDRVEALRVPEGGGQEAAFEFERRVQCWLESLGDPEVVAALPEPLREPVSAHIVPVIETGNVSAAGPRVVRRESA